MGRAGHNKKTKKIERKHKGHGAQKERKRDTVNDGRDSVCSQASSELGCVMKGTEKNWEVKEKNSRSTEQVDEESSDTSVRKDIEKWRKEFRAAVDTNITDGQRGRSTKERQVFLSLFLPFFFLWSISCRRLFVSLGALIYAPTFFSLTN